MKLTIILLLAASVFSCNNKAENKTGDKDSESANEINETYSREIVGKWRPVSVNLPAADSLSKQNLVNHAILEFVSGGKFVTTMQDKVKTGSFLFSEQDSKLTTTMDEGKQETFNLSWDKNNMILTNDEGSVTLKRM